nr:hypothetical protein TorRG33x02_232770 [Ipomoea trifida]
MGLAELPNRFNHPSIHGLVREVRRADHWDSANYTLEGGVPPAVSQKPAHGPVRQDLFLRGPAHNVSGFRDHLLDFRHELLPAVAVGDGAAADHPQESLPAVDKAVPQLHERFPGNGY